MPLLRNILATDWKIVGKGVPQGSCISPLLFNICVRDLPQCHEGETMQFADDVTEHEADESLQVVKRRLTKNYENTKIFFQERGLSINPAKTQFFIVKSPHKKLDSEEFIIIDGLKIEDLKSVKLLGFTLDAHMTFSVHIDQVVKIAKGILGMLKKAAAYLPRDMLRLAYIALVRSRLEYCSLVFDPASKTHLTKLDIVQKIAARVIMDTPSNTHSAPLLAELKLDNLQHRRNNKLKHLVCKSIDHSSHPDINDMFSITEGGELIVPDTPRTVLGKKRFSYFATNKFNNMLPSS